MPSITAAVGENGPCLIMHDSTSTELNPWSRSGRVDMLYIDQPIQAGFSYNTLVNGTLNELPVPSIFEPEDFSATGVPETKLTFLTSTFVMPDLAGAPNTTHWCCSRNVGLYADIDAGVSLRPLQTLSTQLLTTTVRFPEHEASKDKFSI